MPVICEGVQHQVRWSRGRIVLDHHTDDDAERALAALGGRRPECIDIADLWHLAVQDGGFLEEWAERETRDRRRHAWIQVARQRLRQEGIQDLLPRISLARALPMADVLVELPYDLLDRAAVTLVDELVGSDRLDRSDLWPPIERAVQLRARRSLIRSLDRWKDHTKLGALVPFRCLVLPKTEPDLAGRLAGRSSGLDLVLGADWLVDVWGRGIGALDGHLIITAREDPTDDHRIAVRYVDWVPLVPLAAGDGLRPMLRTGAACWTGRRWTLEH